MLAGDLAPVARAALVDGHEGLAPLQARGAAPDRADAGPVGGDVAEALARTGAAAVEWKLDGARLQVHRSGDEVRAFTRSLADVTDRVPEVVAAARRLPVDAAVLDSEVIALTADGRPLPFQETMSRFGSSAARGRGKDVPSVRRSSSTASTSTARISSTGRTRSGFRCPRRARARRRAASRGSRPRIAAEAEAFLDDALARGHEGVS